MPLEPMRGTLAGLEEKILAFPSRSIEEVEPVSLSEGIVTKEEDSLPIVIVVPSACMVRAKIGETRSRKRKRGFIE